jgi:NTP pyrophosphatase (non-canonical NTP hydrolase)
MTFNEYQIKARETAIFPDQENRFIYATLAMMGEAGEVSEKVKKIWRDKGKIVSDLDREEIKKELGDVLWYMSQLALELKIDFDDIASSNINKTQSRLQRNVLHGAGDNR